MLRLNMGEVWGIHRTGCLPIPPPRNLFNAAIAQNSIAASPGQPQHRRCTVNSFMYFLTHVENYIALDLDLNVMAT